ncbi:hypothetical protein BC940DRAFT_306473 [Gongronella butleri]|nr:hypothetical protein BC940DRAFT_306473 [Gongronella butleri]
MKVLSFDHCDMTKEDMRWFIVGAHEAGAAETDIMAMTNLSKHTVRYAIDTYKRTGQPFYERQRQQHKCKQ